MTTLSVIIQTNPPYMTAASADASFLKVSINFSFAMDFATMSDVTHYSLVPVGGEM